MRKINTNKIVALLAALCLMTSAFVGSTLAKYTTTSTASSEARVAKWAFSLNGSPISDTFAFDLFSTVNDANVKKGTGEHIIAPGTTGNMAFSLKNDSEVKAKYTITVDTANTNLAGVPVEFSTDGTDWKVIDQVNFTGAEIAPGDTASDITVHWRWAFGDGATDASDTTLGNAGTANPKVTFKVTVDQVD